MDTNKTLNLEEALKDPIIGDNTNIMKREVDSLDDFEHLDNSPVGGKPVPGAASTAKINTTTTSEFDPLMASDNKMDLLDFGERKKPDTAASSMFSSGGGLKEKDILSSFIERERGDLKIGHGDSDNEDDFKLSKQTIESKADNIFKDFEEFHQAPSAIDEQQQKHIEEEKKRLEAEEVERKRQQQLEEQRRLKEKEEEEAKKLLEQQKRETEEKQRLEEERKRKEAEEKKRIEEEEKRKEEEEENKRREDERKKMELEMKRKEEELWKKAAEKDLVCEIKPKAVNKEPKKTVIEAEAFFCKMGLDAWFNPERLNPQVESLIYWRDPKKSGPVFGGVLLVLLALTYFSLISVIAYLSLLVLTGTVCFRIYKNIVQAVQKTGDGHPFKDLLELDISLSQDKVKEISEVAVAHLNAGVVELRRLFLVEDLVDSIKFGVLLWTLTYLGALFNGMTLIIIAWVALFTFPKVYETNKTQIDANLEIVRNKLAEITAKVKAAIPIGKKAEEKKEQ